METGKYRVHVGNLGGTDVYKSSFGVMIEVEGKVVWFSNKKNTAELIGLLTKALEEIK